MRPISWEKAPTISKIPIGFLIEAEAEATKYALIGLPTETYNVGYFGDGHLIIDPFCRCAYVFRDYVAFEYLHEKWNGRATERDAEILSSMANKLIEYIETEELK